MSYYFSATIEAPFEQAIAKVEVSAVDPMASMIAVNNPQLGDIAVEVQKKLKSVIDRL